MATLIVWTPPPSPPRSPEKHPEFVAPAVTIVVVDFGRRVGRLWQRSRAGGQVVNGPARGVSRGIAIMP
jgi:hypothetical protein